ncbi:MAG: hypothetical protein WAV20_14380 [Blastocatellia bacterium]
MTGPKLFSFLFFLSLISGLSIATTAQIQDRTELQVKLEALRDQIATKEKVFLAPSVEDLSAHAEFLRQPNTGLSRLMPREEYDGKLLTRGGGAYYSFARLTNEYGFGSDLQLQRGELSVGFAGADFGFLTSLGDVAVDNLNVEQMGVRFLAAFNTPSLESDAREQYRRAAIGFEAEGFMYRNSLPAILNRTYALRSVNYAVSDLLVVFRVIRQDTDGSLTLAWKILKKFPVPQLAQ